MHIVHVTTSLDNGGAQAILFNLVRHSSEHRHSVICLTEPGKYSAAFDLAGTKVVHVGMKRGKLSFAGCLSIYRTIKSMQPDVVQTWMYHGDLLGGVLARLAGCNRIVWGIHNSTLDNRQTSRGTRLVVRLLSLVSRWIPTQIISCSQRALDVHAAIGYPRSKMIFVANGYDLDRFQPASSPTASASSAGSPNVSPEIVLNRSDSDVIFATVARWGAQKDQGNLIAAAGILLRRLNSDPAVGTQVTFRCCFVGPDMTSENSTLTALINQQDIADIVDLCGETSDVPGLMNQIDCHVLPSAFGEAFPNVVAEAMACGVPCVVTDVGDAAFMVGDTGWVVPARNAQALSDALYDVLLEAAQPEWRTRKKRCRERATQQFAIATMVDRYEAIWCDARAA